MFIKPKGDEIKEIKKEHFGSKQEALNRQQKGRHYTEREAVK